MIKRIDRSASNNPNPNPDPKPNLSASGSGKPAWYQDVRVISVLLVVIGLLALPLVWINRTMSLKKKIVITLISVVIAIALFWVSGRLLEWVDRETGAVQNAREALLRPSES